MKMQRLPEGRIRNGILHPDQGVRQEAVTYFAQSFCRDPRAMRTAIQAVEKWGWDDAFEFPHVMADLAHNEETLLWLVEELAKAGRARARNLSGMIAGASPELLLKHESRIMELEGPQAPERETIADRVGLLARDAASCWKELERFCEEGKRKRYVNEVNLGHAYNLVEAVARDGEAFEGRVLEILSEEIADYRDNPMAWMEGLAARLAGETRLEATVPLLVEKLLADAGDWTNEQCSRALTQIGTDTVVDAVEKEYPDSESHFRIYAGGALEDIHSDASLEACLRLFNGEDDLDLKFHIGHAVVRQYSPDTLNAMREFILDTPPHRERNSLRDLLVAVAPLTGGEFPEFEEWRELARQTRERHRRLSGELLEGGPPGKSKKPGRNSPCPCGSGKKHKRCCGRRS